MPVNDKFYDARLVQLRRFCATHAVRHVQIARCRGVSRSYVSAVMRGARAVSAAQLDRLAAAAQRLVWQREGGRGAG